MIMQDDATKKFFFRVMYEYRGLAFLYYTY